MGQTGAQTPPADDDALEQLQMIRNIFGVIAPIMLAIGIPGNVLSLVVLNRPKMKVSQHPIIIKSWIVWSEESTVRVFAMALCG